MVASSLLVIALIAVNVVLTKMTNSFTVIVLFLSKSYKLNINSAFS